MLVTLVPGVGMGGGLAAAPAVYVAPIGHRIGVVRSGAADTNAPTGLTGTVN